MNELKKLYEEDIKDRQSRDWNGASEEEVQWLLKRDQGRKNKVISLYKQKKLKSAKDYHYAALIFQHGETSKDFELAHTFASKAVKLGDKLARWLYAATLDRWYLSIGNPQKFGTQFEQDEKGNWKLVEPIDPSTTDQERAEYNVPPLSDALNKFKEKYNQRYDFSHTSKVRKTSTNPK